MVLSDIKTKIGRRVADPNLDTYAEVVQDYFEQAFVTLLKKRDEKSFLPVYENEIVPLIEFSSWEFDLYKHIGDVSISGNADILYVFALTTAQTEVVNYKYVPMTELADLGANPNTIPSSGEGYWSKSGKRIRILSGTETGIAVVQIAVVRSPNTSSWIDSTSFTNYGLGFLYDCIELASSLLRRQIGLEG